MKACPRCGHGFTGFEKHCLPCTRALAHGGSTILPNPTVAETGAVNSAVNAVKAPTKRAVNKRGGYPATDERRAYMRRYMKRRRSNSN